MMHNNMTARQRLDELAFLLNRFGEALFYEVDGADEELTELIGFASARRFDITARRFFEHLAFKLGIKIHDNFAESVVLGCVEKKIFDAQGVELLMLMSNMIADINSYDDEYYVEPEDFLKEMHMQYAFLQKSLAVEFERVDSAAVNPFKISMHGKQSELA